VYAAYLCMVAMLHLMQMSHRWAHVPDEDRGGAITALQRVRFIIPFGAHAKHHVEPYERDFCIMSGLCNKPLNGLAALFGVRSHAWILAFLLTCFVPIASGLAMHYAGV
jgi:hypothetical protein